MSKKVLSKSAISYRDIDNFSYREERKKLFNVSKSRHPVLQVFKKSKSNKTDTNLPVRTNSVHTPKRPAHSRLLTYLYAAASPSTSPSNKIANSSFSMDKSPASVSFDAGICPLSSSLKSRRLLSRHSNSQYKDQCLNFFQTTQNQSLDETFQIKNTELLRHYQELKQPAVPLIFNDKPGNTPFTNELLKKIYIADSPSTNREEKTVNKFHKIRSRPRSSYVNHNKIIGIGSSCLKSKNSFSFEVTNPLIIFDQSEFYISSNSVIKK
ncbi:unnamed protein product [Blepharisma stoltei]|uniref:Uncharacterized protein n=1 Tax=Blepharisma stoltei TaxID=1481888 RepID=A0AAU9J112_9CILI|nr:unnamed protein product [Blepharisma stoltei]